MRHLWNNVQALVGSEIEILGHDGKTDVRMPSDVFGGCQPIERPQPRVAGCHDIRRVCYVYTRFVTQSRGRSPVCCEQRTHVATGTLTMAEGCGKILCQRRSCTGRVKVFQNGVTVTFYIISFTLRSLVYTDVGCLWISCFGWGARGQNSAPS